MVVVVLLLLLLVLAFVVWWVATHRKGGRLVAEGRVCAEMKGTRGVRVRGGMRGGEGLRGM